MTVRSRRRRVTPELIVRSRNLRVTRMRDANASRDRCVTRCAKLRKQAKKGAQNVQVWESRRRYWRRRDSEAF
jgi:hypothetical protein